MKNFEKNIVARMAANVRNQKVTFLTALLLTIIGCAGIVYAIVTPPVVTMPLYSKLGIGFMGLLMIFCDIGLWSCYKKSRKCLKEYNELNKEALEKE
ncbi:MAG: hypothetical protein J6K16_03295 [Alphaproteobacteria bacterium]|nr:hypothetical protein [Alphaproteobacteria bacterium]